MSRRDGDEHSVPPWEPSAWFRNALARAVAELPAEVCRPGTVAVGSLTGWSLTGIVGTAEDRTCDRCREHVPPTGPDEPVEFFTGVQPHVHPLTGTLVVLGFGLCRRCAEREGDAFMRLAVTVP